MSHEIRTPLTNVIGFADVLAETLTDDRAEFVRLIQNGGRRLLRTLDSVLEFARLESGALDLDRAPVDLATVVRDTVTLFQPEARRRRLTLNVDIPAQERAEDSLNRPPSDAARSFSSYRVSGDRTALERILNNLISNALKFTEEGGVTVRLDRDADGVALTVEDTGVGIAKDFLPSLFDPFEQESIGFGRSFEGAGLGLSITHQLVDLHGGSVDVRSRKGEGTAFTVTLPAVDETGAASAG
jgi:signal transduction histidine kinase